MSANRLEIHRTFIAIPDKIYMPEYLAVKKNAKRPDRMETGDYKRISRRFVELIKKGLKFEAMEATAAVAERQPATAERIAPPMASNIAMCCDRAMVDYGVFMSCMVCGEKALK